MSLGRRLVALFMIISVPAAAQRSPGLSDSIANRIDSVVSVFMSGHHVPGLSMAVGLDGNLVWSRGYGVADLENSVPVTTASVFRTASVGKPMTATAVLQLWEAGKLDLDSPVQKYCPAFPVKRWPITSRQLLAHMAGIRDKRPEEEENHRHYPNITAALEIFARDSLIAEPGTFYRYTSYGYDVLGCVIEGASGVPYIDYMNTRIFAAAAMRSTGRDDWDAVVPHRVRGYSLDSAGGLHNSVHDDMSNRIPAGGFVSTPEDLVRFGIAVLSGRLVRDSTRAVMFRVPNGAHGAPLENAFYALGWGTSSWYGEPELAHGGGTPQVSAFLYLLPTKGLVVAVMMNLEGPVADRGDLAGDVAKLVLGPRAPRK